MTASASIAQKDVDVVRLITRNGYDFAERYPLIVDAIRRLIREVLYR